MLERLVVTQTVPQRPLELDQGRKESIVGGASPEHLPEPLDHLQLGTVARQWIEFQMWGIRQHGRDQGPLVPGGFVDHDHHAGILRRGLGAGNVTQMAGERLL
jgi:hypothetical protein